MLQIKQALERDVFEIPEYYARELEKHWELTAPRVVIGNILFYVNSMFTYYRGPHVRVYEGVEVCRLMYLYARTTREP
jgi:hypothetical protein